MKESDMYEPIKEFFEKQGFEVYAEVTVPGAKGRVDVVAYSEPDAVAIEMKMCLSKDLVEQAIKRKRVFPVVFVAIPERKRKIRTIVQDELLLEGIGILEVYAVGSETRVKVLQHPMKGKGMKLRKKWTEILKSEHQTWVPGGHQGGGYVTEYALTMKRIHDYLAEAAHADDEYFHAENSGWRTPNEIKENVKTHFANPKVQIGPALLEHETDWVEAKKMTNRWFFRIKEWGGRYANKK